MTKYVVYSTDENYWIPLYVSLFSLLYNNRNTRFKVFILSNGKNDEFINNTKLLEGIHERFTIDHIEVDDSRFDNDPTPRWFTKSIYYRLLIDSLLPLEQERVLYLDSDTIVNGSLQELFGKNIDSYIAAATPEFKNKCYLMGLPVDAFHYNTGVLYLNLDQWRHHDTEHQVLTYLNEQEDLHIPLQEILNSVLHRKNMWTPVSPKYNWTNDWAGAFQWAERNSVRRYTKNKVDPLIFHYNGPKKPWLSKKERIHKDKWWQYANKTPYSNNQLSNI